MCGLNRIQRNIIKNMVLNGESGPEVREKIDDFIDSRARQRDRHMPDGNTELNEAFCEWLAEQEYYVTAEFLMKRLYR